jgi:hypothetical protein
MNCPECLGCGWRPYFVETVEDEEELAWEPRPECKVGDAFPPRAGFSAELAFLRGTCLSGSQVVLVDPDTGLEPMGRAKVKHIKVWNSQIDRLVRVVDYIQTRCINQMSDDLRYVSSGLCTPLPLRLSTWHPQSQFLRIRLHIWKNRSCHRRL